MPNAPRPLPLTHPASSTRGMLPAADGPATPTGLQRQATSLYSNFSTGSGPLLVYGKAATPIVGDWSAEPWSPAGLAQPGHGDNSQEVHESGFLMDAVPVENIDRMDTEDSEPTFDDFSSAADTAAFVPDEALPPAPTSTPAPEHPADLVNVTAPTQQDTTEHIALVYRHDPYTLAGRRELHRCFCDTCMSAPTTVPAQDHGEVFGQEHFSGAYDAYQQPNTDDFAPPQGFDAPAMDWSEATRPTQQPQPSKFMPPPPPPRITRRVLGESAEPGLDVEAAVYYVSMRWYSKVVLVQENFVADGELCPVPGSPDQTFLEWVDEVGRWWLRHFEHLQTKLSSSSVLLRSSYTSMQARSSGFATHAPLMTKPPRRQVGTSGLSADMLAQLEGREGSIPLPTPRSLEKRRCEELPW